MAIDFTRANADAEAQTTVIDSVVALLDGQAQQIRDLAASLDDPAAQAAVNGLADSMEANTAKAAAAVEAHTTPPTP